MPRPEQSRPGTRTAIVTVEQVRNLTFEVEVRIGAPDGVITDNVLEGVRAGTLEPTESEPMSEKVIDIERV